MLHEEKDIMENNNRYFSHKIITGEKIAYSSHFGISPSLKIFPFELLYSHDSGKILSVIRYNNIQKYRRKLPL